MQLLGRRAEQFRNGNKEVLFNENHNWLVDKTGTIDISCLELCEVKQQEKLDMVGVSDEILQVHGVMPGKKVDGVVRLMYENVNSLSNRQWGNNKLEKAKDLIHEWGADIVGMVEHQQNLKHKNNSNDAKCARRHNLHDMLDSILAWHSFSLMQTLLMYVPSLQRLIVDTIIGSLRHPCFVFKKCTV